MGDRFYQAQKANKPKRRLKKDAIADLEELLGTKVEGLDRATILTIDTLVEAIEKKLLQ
jgi:hypothetical protein